VRNEFTGVFVQAEEGGYWAYCLEVPGPNGQGDTLEACEQNLIEGIRLLLAVTRERAAQISALSKTMPRSSAETVIQSCFRSAASTSGLSASWRQRSIKRRKARIRSPSCPP
jgi:predicted RNase H-like HicB family nuclease